MSIDRTVYELALYVGYCVVISSPDGVEWLTARVEEVECQWPPHDQVVPVSLLTSGLCTSKFLSPIITIL